MVAKRTTILHQQLLEEMKFKKNLNLNPNKEKEQKKGQLVKS